MECQLGFRNGMGKQNTMNSSWLVETKQSWKVWVFLFLMVLLLFLFALFVWRVNSSHATSLLIPDEIVLSLSFVILGIAAFGWLWLSVRCPVCRRSVAAYVLRTVSVSTWFTTLITLMECPVCVERSSVGENVIRAKTK
mgnify:FL=1